MLKIIALATLISTPALAFTPAPLQVDTMTEEVGYRGYRPARPAMRYTPPRPVYRTAIGRSWYGGHGRALGTPSNHRRR